MRAIATPQERQEINQMRDNLLIKVKAKLESVDKSLFPSIDKLNRQEQMSVIDNELRSYRKQINQGRGRPKRAITIYRELKKNLELLDGEFTF